MALRKKTKQTPTTDFSGVAKVIDKVSTQDFLEKSFLKYAYMVILSRAIPDARDGLKPVQRRVLHTMNTLGLTPEKNHVKSARIVGEVMGIFHPHGSSYLTLVRMAQDFALRLPLVDGHGNFGSPGDGPAADRYTESRLSPAATYLLDEVKEDTVMMQPNYDGTTVEPSVLPAQFPNLLVNGSTGIAVGMGCNLPPHNPDEVIAAARWLLTHPNATVERLMDFVPGPDFPTGALILGNDAIKEAYTTGRGIIKIRARHTVESIGRGKNQIIFTEMPYETSIEKVIEEIKKKIDEGKLQGIADAADFTDRENGIRFVVETKTGINPEVLAMDLFKLTSLEVSYGINNTVITPAGTPETLGLKELLQIFLDHRIETVRNRTVFRAKKKRDRLHHVDALLKALLDIDKVIKIIRNADDPASAQQQLMKGFKMDELQAEYVMNLQLRRLTKFNRLELERENEELKKEIAELDLLLSDETRLRKLISDELAAVGKKISTPRRSEIVGGSLAEHAQEAKKIAASATIELADEPCVISLTQKGSIVRNAKPARGAKSTALTTTRGRFIAITNKGRGFRIDALHVGEKPVASSTVLPESLEKGEKVICLTPVALEEGKVGGLAMGTKQGIVKVLAPNWPKTLDTFDVMGLQDGDEIIGSRWVDDNTKYDFVFITSDSSLLTFPAEKVRPQGALSAAGVAGIKYDPANAEVVDFSVVSAEEKEKALVVSVSDAGNAKFTPYKLYPQKGRATGGVRSLKFLKGETKVSYSTVTVSPTLVTEDGTTLEALPVDNRRDGSGKPLGGVPAK